MTRLGRGLTGAVMLGSLALVLSGCGGRTHRPSDQPTEVVVHSAALQRLFEALATVKPGRQRAALDLTATGSPAHRYVAFQVALSQARHDAGVKPSRSRVVRTEGGYDLCAPGSGRQRCTQFTGLRMRDGLLSTFSVDGDPVADKVSAGSGVPERLDTGASVQFLSSYLQPSTGNYWVVFRVDAGDGLVQLRLGSARYARVGGEVLTPATRSPVPTVPAGQSRTLVLVYPDAEVGGTVRLNLRDGSQEQEVNLETAPYVPPTSSPAA